MGLFPENQRATWLHTQAFQFSAAKIAIERLQACGVAWTALLTDPWDEAQDLNAHIPKELISTTPERTLRLGSGCRW